MDLSSSMMSLGARQLGGMVGETASSQAMGAALRLLQESARTARVALPGEAGLEWLELANKLEAFQCFQQAPALLELAPGQDLPLEEQLQRASGLGVYPSVWAREGLGYAHARQAWKAGRPPQGLLVAERLPAHAIIPLHTGAALAFAARLLEAEPVSSTAVLEAWLALWEQNAHPCHRDLAVEGLGLVARNLYPHRVQRTGELLGALAPGLDEPFWHGVGRGLYFAPTHALPWSGAAGRAFDKAWREPPHEAGRRNATAGLAWALTLVNFRHPEILADVLSRHGSDIGSFEAFSQGVASAVLIWYDTVGQDRHLTRFLAHRPAASNSRFASLWRDVVLAPGETALQRTYPALQRSGGLAALFRWRPDGGLEP